MWGCLSKHCGRAASELTEELKELRAETDGAGACIEAEAAEQQWWSEVDRLEACVDRGLRGPRSVQEWSRDEATSPSVALQDRGEAAKDMDLTHRHGAAHVAERLEMAHRDTVGRGAACTGAGGGARTCGSSRFERQGGCSPTPAATRRHAQRGQVPARVQTGGGADGSDGPGTRGPKRTSQGRRRGGAAVAASASEPMKWSSMRGCYVTKAPAL